eukprot:13090756-Heterocapsa_arctica.AAC.1
MPKTGSHQLARALRGLYEHLDVEDWLAQTRLPGCRHARASTTGRLRAGEEASQVLDRLDAFARREMVDLGQEPARSHRWTVMMTSTRNQATFARRLVC